jgi:hypothetical protein
VKPFQRHNQCIFEHQTMALLQSESSCCNRRDFFTNVSVATCTATWIAPFSLTAPTVAFAAAGTAAVGKKSNNIKVSPVSHTFITSSGFAAKPIRENDATRYFTNARVVYLLEGQAAKPGVLASEIIKLTTKRKADRGAGVTPGNVQTLKSGSVKTVVDTVRSLPEGDVLLVGPIPSGGIASDGKVLTETATALGTFVGGKTGGGVISVLLDGPKENIKLEESGYPTSELLWFSLP